MKKLNINEFGAFRLGLSSEEIEEYLLIRAKGTKYDKYTKKRLFKKFYLIAGVNTCSLVNCPICRKPIVLMYRHDVKRFADKLFEGKNPYWD